MIKQLPTALFGLCVSLAPMTFAAPSYTCGNMRFEVMDYNSRTLKFCGVENSYADSVLIIPTTINVDDSGFGREEDDYDGNPLGNWFIKELGRVYTPSNVISITVPEGITEINGFSSRLKELKLPSTLKSINHSALINQYNLRKLELPQNLEYIGGFAFSDCSSLEEINIPSKVKEIPIGAFHQCRSLKHVSFPDGLTNIGEQAFYYCSNLSEIELPDSLKSIQSAAFLRAGLQSIKVSDGVSEIPSHAFSECYKLTSIELPVRLKRIGDEAFFDTSIESIELPETLESIGTGVFNCCRKLQSVAIPESVSTLGAYMFYGCDNLSEVKLPSNITEIGDYMFFSCGLSEIEIPNKVEVIGRRAFSDNGRIIGPFTKIILPDSLKYIGEGAFEECIFLTEMVIPDKVTTIGFGAFIGCSVLEKIKLGRELQRIDDKAFLNCNYIRYVECNGETPPDMGYKVFSEHIYDDATLVVPDNAKDDYADFNCWKDFFDVKTKSEVDDEFGPVPNINIDSDGISIFGEGGRIRVNGADGQFMHVYNLSGTCVYSGDCETTSYIGKGIYVVKIGNNHYKVYIR